jgi:hypothetical protein
MRSAGPYVPLAILFLAATGWGRQTTQSPSQPASDPQAVAIVQAAITALGGATAISQPQTWTFQAHMQGAHANGNVTYVMSTDKDTGEVIAPDGTSTPARPIRSHFVPVLIASVLLNESLDPRFSFFFERTDTQDSKPVSVVRVMLTDGAVNSPAQFWSFDAANLPVRVDFRLAAEVGARRSFPLVVSLSNYQAVGGVLYPFSVITFLPGTLPEWITLQSISTEASAIANDFNGQGGDLR